MNKNEEESIRKYGKTHEKNERKTPTILQSSPIHGKPDTLGAHGATSQGRDLLRIQVPQQQLRAADPRQCSVLSRGMGENDGRIMGKSMGSWENVGKNLWKMVG